MVNGVIDQLSHGRIRGRDVCFSTCHPLDNQTTTLRDVFTLKVEYKSGPK